MSYETLKKLNINLKDLTIKYAYSSSQAIFVIIVTVW